MFVLIVLLGNSSVAKLLETEAVLVTQCLALQTCIPSAIYNNLLPSTLCLSLCNFCVQ